METLLALHVFDKMLAVGDGGGFGTTGGPELGEDDRDDFLDCVFRDAELPADVEVGTSGGKWVLISVFPSTAYK